MLVQDFLERSASIRPNKIALVCEGQRLTYAEIDAMANRLANALLDNGIRRGDRVAIFLPNSVLAVVAIFATLKAGGVSVVINSSTKQDKLAYILQDCEASALIANGRQMSIIVSMLNAVPSLKLAVHSSIPSDQRSDLNATISSNGRTSILSFDIIQTDFRSECPPKTNIDLDLACLIYTSGSTGEPKGVMSDHSNVDFATSSIIQYLENNEDDIVINVLPLSFDYGLYQLLMTFKFGGTLILERTFAYPAAILKRIEAEKVTGFPGVPTLFAMLLKMDLSKYDLSSLRYLTNTAAALPVSHILKIRDMFPSARLFSMYGLTETKRTLYLPPEQLDKRPGSVGIPIPGTEAFLVDEAGNRLGVNQTGELVVRGRHVMRGYWNAPFESAERFRPGLLPGERLCYTGDLFRMDEDGYLYFVTRKDDIIKSRGEKVAPKEVENVLYSLPGVLEAAVVGKPDPVLGEAIKAYLVLDGVQLTEADVLAHCRSHLEDFMVPQAIEFCSELPKTTSGKIKKTDLI
ncbi:MAG: AMP-binding protein [Anaerolineales bacterium]|nr:AMP-binding protein [Anaerolineales bacterium]